MIRPPVLPEVTFLLQAYDDIKTCRPVNGMGAIMPIPFTAIDAWAVRHKIDDPDLFDLLRSGVRIMDRFEREDFERRAKEAGTRTD